MSDVELAKRAKKLVRSETTKLYNILKPDFVKKLDRDTNNYYIDRVDSYLVEINRCDAIIIAPLMEDDTVDDDEILALRTDTDDNYKRKVSIMRSRLLNNLSTIASSSVQSTTPPPSSGTTNPITGAKLKLPQIDLPSYQADNKIDKLTCRKFFDKMESKLKGYNLDEDAKFSVLMTSLGGRALSMVESLEVASQSYSEAKDLLLDTFEIVTPVQFNVIEKLLKIRMVKNDSIGFFAEFRKLLVSMKDLSIDLDIVIQYLMWNGITKEMQEALVQVTGETYPDLNLIKTKYTKASHRFEALLMEKPKKESFKTSTHSVSFNETPKAKPTSPKSKTKARPKNKGKAKQNVKLYCRCCNVDDHATWNCKKFLSPRDKINELNKLGFCTKCSANTHKANECKTFIKFKCRNCGQKNHREWLCFKPQGGASSSSAPPASGTAASHSLAED